MQTITKDGTPQLLSAILLYGTDAVDEVQGQFFATVHPVRHAADGSASIAPGVPATKAAVLAALRHLIDERLAPSILPAHVLARGADHLVWYRPASKRTLWFRCEELGGERSAVVPIPAVLWMAHPLSNECSVFALRSDDRPDSDTELYQAPFYNVWDTGRVCVGNVGMPTGIDALDPAKWEEAFFSSWFSHSNTSRLVRHKAGITDFTNNLLNGKHRVFPKAKLYPLRTTVGKQFEAFMKRVTNGQA